MIRIEPLIDLIIKKKENLYSMLSEKRKRNE